MYVGTFSRVLCPSIRLSYLVLPPALLDRFLTKSNSYDQYAAPIFQKTLYLFMESGDFHRHVRANSEVIDYSQKRQYSSAQEKWTAFCKNSALVVLTHPIKDWTFTWNEKKVVKWGDFYHE
ncbi:hypothetical protein NST23_07920 [Brevibacillus sp. FSL K6-0770]|uniref:Uncharacterized protein n=1 Tax=Brevibacillus parabrevis TaxID=54914 RepID=A0A4Y3PVK1_BREPA|nr:MULTISPECIES: hypothetical protein [Brevibacillus]MDH6348506.1 hypothetical protein [Brevibacillus sp. 1238]GEB35518.1 hypothetical protein BPA01_50980 [Brevibacillus parabrevis]